MVDFSHPLPAFHFAVRIGMAPAKPFSEVDGIGATMETDPIEEGGENRFIRAMPKKINFSPLVLKRAIANKASPLTQWCTEIFDSGLTNQIKTRSIHILLLDENRLPVRQWMFSDAYPTGWTVDSFGSTKNDVALEVYTFNYHDQQRVL